MKNDEQNNTGLGQEESALQAASEKLVAQASESMVHRLFNLLPSDTGQSMPPSAGQNTRAAFGSTILDSSKPVGPELDSQPPEASGGAGIACRGPGMERPGWTGSSGAGPSFDYQTLAELVEWAKQLVPIYSSQALAGCKFGIMTSDGKVYLPPEWHREMPPLFEPPAVFMTWLKSLTIFKLQDFKLK